MKYIRTKDGKIYKTLEDYMQSDLPSTKIRVEDVAKGWHNIIPKSKIIKQADTIEELCDEFIVVSDNCERPIISALPFNELQLYAKGRTKYAICYGAIWTEWGLKFVAKINEKGELQLL